MIHRRDDGLSSRTRRILGGVAMAFLALFTAIPVANAAEVMRVTFVRHGQSYGNTSGLIDTSTPGPVLTPDGQQQAQDIVKVLGDNNYDAIYASTMVRTQLTAAPMSQYLGLPIQVLPGLQEIEAGDYEGTPERDAVSGYLVAPIKWVQGDLNARIPGSIDGNEFDARVDGALQTMYDNGDRNPVVFSHGGTIMFWTMMNVDNLSTAEKFALFARHPLSNTGYVVIEGNPEDGWTLVNWDGEEIGPQPSFGANVELQVRTLSRQLQQAVEGVVESFATRDPAAIATAINRGIAEASFSVVKFGRAINAEVIKRVDDAVPTDAGELQDTVSGSVENVKTSVTAGAESIKREAQSVQQNVSESVTGASKLADTTTDTGKSTVDDAVERVTKPRGATDLSDGNKAVPGEATKSVGRSGQRVREAIEGAREQVTSSLQKISDAVKKVTGQAEPSAKPADADTGDADSDTGKDAA